MIEKYFILTFAASKLPHVELPDFLMTGYGRAHSQHRGLQCAHSHLLHHMEHFEPHWHTIKLPGMHPRPRNALTKMPKTQLN